MSQVPARYLLARIQTFETTFGVQATDMLAGTGIDLATLNGELKLPGATVELEQDLMVYRNALLLAPTPGSAFVIGRSLRPGDFGLLGHALISCTTVGDAFALINDIITLDGSLLETRYTVEHNEVIIQACPIRDTGELHPFLSEEMLAVWRYSELPVPGLARYVTLVEVDYAEPDHSDLYREMFDCPVVFSAPRTAAHLPLSVLQEPIRYSDPQVAAILRARINGLLKRMQPGEIALKEVEEALISIPIDYWSAERLADRLGWSVGKLHRTLAGHGSTYRTMRLNIRYAMALQYLDDPELGVAQIAKLLGYATPSNFIRFFKSRAGATPEVFRRQT